MTNGKDCQRELSGSTLSAAPSDLGEDLDQHHHEHESLKDVGQDQKNAANRSERAPPAAETASESSPLPNEVSDSRPVPESDQVEQNFTTAATVSEEVKNCKAASKPDSDPDSEVVQASNAALARASKTTKASHQARAEERKLDDVPTSGECPKPAGTSAPASETRRSSRKRASPSRLAAEASSEQTTSKYAKGTNGKVRRGTANNKWDPTHLMQSRSSLLCKIDYTKLLKVLKHPKAWSSLSNNEQMKLMRMVPKTVAESLKQNTDPFRFPEHILRMEVVRSDLRGFHEHLTGGLYEPRWLEQAKSVSEQRTNGHFDQRKEGHFEAYWGQKSTFEAQQSTTKQAPSTGARRRITRKKN